MSDHSDLFHHTFTMAELATAEEATHAVISSQLLEQMPSPLNIAIPRIDQYHNSRITGSATMQEWETTQNGCKCAVHNGLCALWMIRVVFT